MITISMVLLAGINGCKKDGASANADQLTDKPTLELRLSASDFFQRAAEMTAFAPAMEQPPGLFLFFVAKVWPASDAICASS